MTTTSSRREFLQVTVAVGGGLVASLTLPRALRAAMPAPVTDLAPNPFVRISPDNWVTIVVGHSEMGQGTSTALPMIVAEELDADWSRVRWEQSPTAPAYASPVFHIMVTGGSMTTPGEYEPQRKAGAAVRLMLVAAAARKWGVAPATCRTESGRVLHAASGRSATYGELASDAAAVPVPAAESITLKSPKDFRIIGTPRTRLDARTKVDGTAQFGLDVQVPGMLTALIARPPVINGKVKSFDPSAASAVPGVKGVYEVPEGIAIVAKDYWAAKRGRDALVASWDPDLGERITSGDQRTAYRKLMDVPGTVARQDGDVSGAAKAARKTVTATYEFPYLAHACMEPLNCVADVRADSCEIWVGTQSQTLDTVNAARAAGLKPEQVKLHTMFLGGGFGRRSNPQSDFTTAAVHVAKAAGAPVKLIWTREDDMKAAWYRPTAVCRVTATLDAAGNPTSFAYRIAVQSIAAPTPFAPFMIQGGVDALSVEGAREVPYAIPNVLVDLHTTHYNVPVLWLRGVGHNINAYAVETFIDELAGLAGKDPYQYRRTLLTGKPRHLAVLDAAARAAGWGKPLPAGVHRGIAVHSSYGSFTANVVELSVSKSREVTLKRVVCAFDCGRVINPDLVKAQMESSVVFGLSSTLLGEITLAKGVVQQGNYDDYPILRMYQTPPIEVVLVPSDEAPSGAGEPGVPTIGPAVANAIAAATGERVRTLPVKHSFTLA
jgi:isoquinoline 1-oxidoreductase beta subunit